MSNVGPSYGLRAPIELLPRLLAFAKDKGVSVPGVDGLVRLLQGSKPEANLARLFSG